MAVIKSQKVIGMMSGTSLDGLDIACCRFSFDQKWHWEIMESTTIAYPPSWAKRLRGLMEVDALTLSRTHVEYGHFLGQQLAKFIEKHHLEPNLVASHGHTVFHQPREGFTLQIGDGNAIAAETGLPVVFDFRSLDVALGGQGAPLVPVGDRLLFKEYDYCLNLGGIANISYEVNKQRLAYDICPVNMILNLLANKRRLPFDDSGEIASAGRVDVSLLKKLNGLAYYQQEGVKTLGREWFVKAFQPLFENYSISLEDQLRTVVEHIAHQITAAFKLGPNKQVLITGGGALNTFLLARIKDLTDTTVIIPDETLIHYKEALLFAFLGVLRQRGEINCYASVTGASRDSSCGVITY